MYNNFESVEFRNCNNTFYRVDDGIEKMEYDFIDDLDEEEREEWENVENNLQKHEVWVDPMTFNTIIFERYDLTKEESENIDISDEISGAIRNSAYNYVINALNTTTNTLVYWSQVEGTTSDYAIYYNMVGIAYFTYMSFKMRLDAVEISNEDEFHGYKYIEIKNEKKYKVNLPADGT